MHAERIRRIEASADKLVRAAVRRPSAENFQALLPSVAEAPNFTTGDGYNLFHAFFKKLIADKRVNSVSAAALGAILTALFEFETQCQEAHPAMTPWFHEATPGNYKSQPLHVVVDSTQFRLMGELLNWLIEKEYWTTLLGAKINYPLFGRFYFEQEPRFMLGLNHEKQLQLLRGNESCKPLVALELVINEDDDEFAEYVKLMQHFACYGWDGLSRAGSSVVWEFVCNVGKRAPLVGYSPANLAVTFPNITEEDLPLFQQLATFLPEMEDEVGRFINVLIKNFLQGQWAAQSPDAYANSYRLLKLHLKKSEDRAYAFGHYLFMYAYMVRYGALEQAPDMFFEDMYGFILSCGETDVSTKIDRSLLHLLVQLAQFSYSRHDLLPKMLHDAATEEGDKVALDQIDRYERPVLAAAIQSCDFARFVYSLKRTRLKRDEFVELFHFACAVEVSAKLKREHQKIMQVMFDGLCVLNKNLVASLNLLARGILKLDSDIFVEEGEFLKLELSPNCEKSRVENLVNRYTCCNNFRIYAVREQQYVTLVHKSKEFTNVPKRERAKPVVVARLPEKLPEPPEEPKKLEEPKKSERPREEVVNHELLGQALQEYKTKLQSLAARILVLEKKIANPAINFQDLERELRQIQKDVSEALDELAIDRSLKLKRIFGRTEFVFYEKFNRLAKNLGQKCRRVAQSVDQRNHVPEPRMAPVVAPAAPELRELPVLAPAAPEQDLVYHGLVGLFAPVGGAQPQGDRPVEQCLPGRGNRALYF